MRSGSTEGDLYGQVEFFLFSVPFSIVFSLDCCNIFGYCIVYPYGSVTIVPYEAM